MKRNMKRNRKKDFLLFDDVEQMHDIETEGTLDAEEPKEWTLITALNHVLSAAEDSKLSKSFWKHVEAPMNYLTEQLGLTKMQILFVAMLIETGEPMSWRMFGEFLGCSRLSMMVYTDELDDLVSKRWVYRKAARELGSGRFEGVNLEHGVITALRHNKQFVPEKIDGLTEQEFVQKVEVRIGSHINDHDIKFADVEEWLERLCMANPQLPICQTLLKLDDIHSLSLFLLIVFDYAQYADSDNEGLSFTTIDNIFPDEFECNGLRHALRNENQVLMQQGLIEYKCEEGVANTSVFVLTTKAKQELLSEYKPSFAKSKKHQVNNRYLKSFSSIKAKDLYYNIAEQDQVFRLTSLLSQDNLPSVQRRLEEQGMRKGFACLFYGAPGTGKTETVLQLARKTGRNIMQVDIAGLRDKWVGESEKNIKAIFSNYRNLCKSSDVMPILFFNEADAIINKRTENVSQSVDKMDNAMQNIILQELEDLDGILIATTNLTSNLDSAFDRRFLFKIEFKKPNADVKAKIWSSMLKDISDADALLLASKYDLSGGQIENIARKRTIDYILSGQYADVEGIEVYCQNELIDTRKSHKSVIGFK